MLTDAQIKEISLLRSYASRLDTFKDVILVGCGALLLKAESIKDDLQNISNRLDYDVRYSNNQADYVIRRYEEIVDRYQLTSQNSVLLGSTATDAKAKLSQLNNCAEEIKSKISHINSLMVGLQERTGAYTLAVRSMSEKGCEQLRKRCDILEQYKEQQS
jgi:hypothetical protein